ncbi:MAG: MFS transporter [Ruminococcus sp.]|nr:MFS transporter [Ruminococcus sp.]MBO5164933.1 MFS transporter [Ruminococcus sp.]
MTAATSSKPKSFFGTRYKNDISGNKKLLIVNIVLQILGLPVLSVIALIGFYLDTLEDTEANRMLSNAVEAGCTPFISLAVVTICISLFLGMVIALFHFSYLYRKTITDMNYALPLSGTQRFFADFLSGLTVYMLPAIGAVILSIAIMGIGTPFLPPMAEFWEAFPDILKLVFIVLVAMILFYSLSVLAISFCGNTFEAIFSIIAFNSLIPAAIACLWMAMCEGEPYGIDEAAIMMKNIFTSTSPIGSFVFFVNYVAEVGFSSGSFSYYTSLYFKWIFITLAVSALYMLAAYLLCRFRKAEDVSKPYVYKAAFYAIMTMAVFCVLSLFIAMGAFIVAGIVICAVGWFIMEVITRRGFKKFWQAGIGFAASVISVLLVCQVCEVTNGFGMAKKVPLPLTVESVNIGTGNLLGIYEDIRFSDKDVIKESVELQKELIDRYFNYDDYNYEIVENTNNALNDYGNTISLRYSTLTGSTILRRYDVPSGMAGDLIKAILLSDEYAEAISQNICEYYYNDEEDYRIEVTDKLYNRSDIRAKDQMVLDLRQAYYDDMSAMTEEELLRGDVYCYVDEQWVLTSFSNTIELLESWGISFNEINKGDFDAYRIGYIDDPVFTNYAQDIFKPQDKKIWEYQYDERDYCVADSITAVRVQYKDYSYAAYSVMRDNDKIVEVVKRCTPMVFGEKPIAVFFVNDIMLYLPDRGDNRQLLEDFKKASSDKAEKVKEKVNFTVGTTASGEVTHSDVNGWD